MTQVVVVLGNHETAIGPTSAEVLATEIEAAMPWLFHGDGAIRWQTRRDLLDQTRPTLVLAGESPSSGTERATSTVG